MDVLRMELLGQPVRVSEIDPGMVETEFSLVRFGGDEQRAAKVYEGVTPLTARRHRGLHHVGRRPGRAMSTSTNSSFAPATRLGRRWSTAALTEDRRAFHGDGRQLAVSDWR